MFGRRNGLGTVEERVGTKRGKEPEIPCYHRCRRRPYAPPARSWRQGLVAPMKNRKGVTHELVRNGLNCQPLDQLEGASDLTVDLRDARVDDLAIRRPACPVQENGTVRNDRIARKAARADSSCYGICCTLRPG